MKERRTPSAETSIKELRIEDLDEENRRIFLTFGEAAREHPLVVKNGIYRFKEDPKVMQAYIDGEIDFNALIREVHSGRMKREDFLKLLRDTGSSLDHYASVLETPSGLFGAEQGE